VIRRILVPLDGSVAAAGVLPHVEKLARALGSRVDLVHAIAGGRDSRRHGVEDPLAYRLLFADRAWYLESQAAGLRQQGIEVGTIVEAGEPASMIVDLVPRGSYDLIALTTRGSGGATGWMGCTAVAVALNARCSLLMIPQSDEPQVTQIDRPRPTADTKADLMMVAVDCSARSDWTTSVAAAIARGTGARLQLVHALDRPEIVSRSPGPKTRRAQAAERIAERNGVEALRYLEQTVGWLTRSGLKAEARLMRSETGHVRTLQNAIETLRPSLVVVGAHGRGASEEWPLGGTSTKLLFCSRRPVLIVQDLRAAPLERGRRIFDRETLRPLYAL
jgi:nucleotide-binding universal stress UspA family protein